MGPTPKQVLSLCYSASTLVYLQRHSHVLLLNHSDSLWYSIPTFILCRHTAGWLVDGRLSQWFNLSVWEWLKIPCHIWNVMSSPINIHFFLLAANLWKLSNNETIWSRPLAMTWKPHDKWTLTITNKIIPIPLNGEQFHYQISVLFTFLHTIHICVIHFVMHVVLKYMYIWTSIIFFK